MREAHAVRLDAVLARLNQLRQAGELKFLNEVPPAEPTRIVFVNSPAPAVETAPVRNPAPADKPEPADQTSSETRSESVDADAHDAADTPPSETAAIETSEMSKAISPESESESEAEVDSSDETVPDAAPPIAVTQNQPAAAAASEPVISPENGGRTRHSIANDDPAALREALNDPYIHDAAELFGGQVIDIHR